MWLILDEKSEASCNRIIKFLAGKYRSVSFQSHITAGGIPDWQIQEVAKMMDKISDGVAPFELTPQTVQCKSFPYQKITVGIEKSSVLNHLHRKIDSNFEGDYSKKDYPHVSFLYSTIPCKKIDEEDLKEVERRCLPQVSVNQIALVHCKGTPEEWRTLYMCALNS